MESIDVFAPLASLQWVDRNTIHANDYNPNKVSEEFLSTPSARRATLSKIKCPML